jgi:hypothetical protein
MQKSTRQRKSRQGKTRHKHKTQDSMTRLNKTQEKKRHKTQDTMHQKPAAIVSPRRFCGGLNVPLTTAAHSVARVRSFSVGYKCRKARAVANGPSAGLLVQIILLAISFSNSVIPEFRKRPPVASRYSPIVRVNDSLMPRVGGSVTVMLIVKVQVRVKGVVQVYTRDRSACAK